MNVFLKKIHPETVLFVSGSGANARELLKSKAYRNIWNCKAILTDRPETSGAAAIAAEFGLPLIEHDIRKFYRQHGLNSTSMATEEGKRVRQLWDERILELLAPYSPDFILFAGFFSLTGIAEKYICLNIHPGDLTHEENGKRVYVGLNLIPVERAILNGEKFLRSSVLIVQPFCKNAGVDAGPLPGISSPVPVDLEGHSLDELRKIAENRKPGHAPDLLSELADRNQINLKMNGDLIVFPQVVEAFASGRYALDEQEGLLWKMENGNWIPIRTIEFSQNGFSIIKR